jgi:hypothetical protein
MRRSRTLDASVRFPQRQGLVRFWVSLKRRTWLGGRQGELVGGAVLSRLGSHPASCRSWPISTAFAGGSTVTGLFESVKVVAP